MNHLDAKRADQADSREQVAQSQATDGKLDHRDAEVTEPFEEDAVAGRRDDHAELRARESSDQVEHMLGPSTRRGGDQKVEDPDRAGQASRGRTHFAEALATRPAPPAPAAALLGRLHTKRGRFCSGSPGALPSPPP